ncbi:DeoR family transcriptional regulator, partial [Pseudomonas aeruginosa]
RQVFLAADSSKFGRNAVVRLGPISLVNRVISDSPPPAAIARLMAQHKVHLDLV